MTKLLNMKLFLSNDISTIQYINLKKTPVCIFFCVYTIQKLYTLPKTFAEYSDFACMNVSM